MQILMIDSPLIICLILVLILAFLRLFWGHGDIGLPKIINPFTMIYGIGSTDILNSLTGFYGSATNLWCTFGGPFFAVSRRISQYFAVSRNTAFDTQNKSSYVSDLYIITYLKGLSFFA